MRLIISYLGSLDNDLVGMKIKIACGRVRHMGAAATL